MAKYIIISHLTDEGARSLKRNPDRLKEVNRELDAMGVKVLEQFAVHGNFDFLNIVEAEDSNAMSRAVVEMASRGGIKTETYTAIPIDEFIESLK